MAQGHPVRREDFYVAPKYADNVADDVLVKIVNQSKPAHVIIGVGGGVQEKLGFYLKRHCASKPAIHCIGAAIGFLTGDQVRIPDWADQWTLGWLFRCWANPGRFVPRYAKAFQLSAVLCKYSTQLPELEKAASTDDVYLSHTPAL
jgi:UDP-N-acetyl-D-mannosaminuronic acid transferase (WecB/TagA/CpsF family)